MATEDVVGTVRAKQRTVLEAKMSGRIEQVLAVPGQSLQQGDLLLRLDAREIQARLDQAIAQRQQTEGDLARYTTLVGQDAVTRQEFDAAQARQRIARAAVTEAETLLGYARVTAPFAGVLTRKLVDVGDLAAPGRPLMEMEDPTTFRLEADVGEGLIDRLHTGQQLAVTIAALQEPLAGVVTEIAPAADPSTRTFAIKIDLPSVPGLRGGAFGRAAVPVGENRVLRVPAEAVVQRGQLECLFVEVDGKARLRLVRTGRRIGAEIEILAGVTAGDRVIASEVARIQEGQSVQAQP